MLRKEIARDVYVVTGKAFSSNAVVVASDEGVILIDALASEEDGAELRRFIVDELGKSVRYIISTHYFDDHIAGLKCFPEAQVIAHVSYAQTAALWEPKSDMERHFVPASMLVSSRLLIRWGRYNLDIFHNPGHTMGMLNVDVEGADLIAVGDTFVGHLVFVRHADPELLPLALRRVKERDRRHIVSGHDGLSSSSCLDKARDYYKRLLSFAHTGAIPQDISKYTAENRDFSFVERALHGVNIEHMSNGGAKRFLRRTSHAP
jgi:glyoxylase-like metal-dependent hydrolase (beta-lactamase superfamily II)